MLGKLEGLPTAFECALILSERELYKWLLGIIKKYVADKVGLQVADILVIFFAIVVWTSHFMIQVGLDSLKKHVNLQMRDHIMSIFPI